ncbi:MAG TPA: hypothetical protein VN043_06880 [Rhodanobacter sp.]|jgi:hypothetical protein|nr:hypothetical protein [Rhodanobacter sp.]
MYALNETNALYFFPHKISFAPYPAADDVGRHRHWSLRHVSAVSPRALPLRKLAPQSPKPNPAEQGEIDRQASEAHRMDEAQAGPSTSEPGKR